jgi:hypothetical protein
MKESPLALLPMHSWLHSQFALPSFSQANKTQELNLQVCYLSRHPAGKSGTSLLPWLASFFQAVFPWIQEEKAPLLYSRARIPKQ